MMRFIKKLIAQLIAKIMAINVLYFGGGGGAGTATSGGNIQTIVKQAVLETITKTFPPKNGEEERQYFEGHATFPSSIPADYELYYNGQWYSKGQLGERVKDELSIVNTILVFAARQWQASDVLEMKYQVIV